MSLQLLLSNEDRPCVLCGKVSERGIVSQVMDNRFFICSDCIEIEVLILVGMLRLKKPEIGETCYCVLCGRSSSKGIPSEINKNWFFICPFCVYGNALSSILAYWWGLKSFKRTRSEPRDHLNPDAKKQQENVDHNNISLMILIDEILVEGFGTNTERFPKMFKTLRKNIFEDICKKISEQKLHEFAKEAIKITEISKIKERLT